MPVKTLSHFSEVIYSLLCACFLIIWCRLCWGSQNGPVALERTCPCHSISIWLSSKMFLQHTTSGLSSPLPSFHSVMMTAPPSALTCLLSAPAVEWRPEGTFRHMDLPFVYYLLDRGVTAPGADFWLALVIQPFIQLAFTCREVWRKYGLKLEVNSWLLVWASKGTGAASDRGYDIPVKWNVLCVCFVWVSFLHYVIIRPECSVKSVNYSKSLQRFCSNYLLSAWGWWKGYWLCRYLVINKGSDIILTCLWH